ncbi:M24 family metallopeptidase [bacterium]|nr:M24 family metallopeptidase [bacterium]
MNKILEQINTDYLLVNSTNKYLVEYSLLSENARYTLTGFTGSTGDALITKDNIYLFVDGRYHTQADNEVKQGITVVKLNLGQSQDDEIRKLINPEKTLGIVSKKISQKRLEGFDGYKIKLLDEDPINNFTENHTKDYIKAFEPINYRPKKAHFISNLEEVSYITGLRDFSSDNTSKIWAKLFVDNENQIIFTEDKECGDFLKNYEGEIVVNKALINAYDYALIKHPIDKPSEIAKMKSVKTENEIEAYKRAFDRTDKAVAAIREYIESNDNLSEYDISKRLKEEFMRFGAKSLSFNSIVAINQNSALAHYSKNSKEVFLKDGDLVLIDCGAYYESGLATDITRVFVKGTPNEFQKKVYTTVLKSFLNCYNADYNTGIEYDSLAHSLLDNAIDGFKFNHGLGHGIGINVHEAPPNLSQNEIAKTEIVDGMCFTIEPGLYNPEFFGVRLENSCYKKDGKIHSFVKMGYEGKLIDFNLLSTQEKELLKEFNIL